ncbi:hypothetical protein [Candidatus Villigracilis affinis]|uniref:hypothetical protein n=1 Tax=Candidatus Villigracilis affinis TaxID=3140682 RepID=UPI002A194183|nr:hypothetical protein [Anaerolineales bacterium]
MIENAQKILYSLDPDAWRKMKQDAEMVINKAESLLSNANNAFEEGDLPLIQSLLDQAKSSAGGTQAWRDLHAKMMRVVLWRKWQEDNFEKLYSSEYHLDLLNAIRNYAEHGLPLKYWSGTAAEAYSADGWRTSVENCW